MAKKKGAFGKRKNKINERPFVGRQEEIGIFAKNLLDASDDFINIFNIHGQSGVGKSTLIQQQFMPLTEKADYAVAYIESDDPKLREIPALLNDIVEKLKEHGAVFKEFSKLYKNYRQELGTLEADPEHPQGTFGSIIGQSIRWGSKAGREMIPGGGLAVSDGLIDTVAKVGGNWADFVARKVTNKDEVDLILRPIEVLTPLWLKDFDKFTDDKKCALFFDTYEASDDKLDKFLRDLLNQKYGDIPLPDNLILCISGQDPLDKQYWEEWKGITEDVPLSEFTEGEARAYLTQKGVTSEAAMKQILAISKCLPVYLSLLGEGNPNSKDEVFNPNERVVEHFLRHIQDPLLRDIAVRAALPRRFNRDILVCLLTRDLPEGTTAKDLFDWLKSRPFVKKQYGAWTYHPIVREMMQRYVRENSPSEWEKVHKQAADYYRERCERMGLREEEKQFENEEWCANRVEVQYHLLGENYTLNINSAIEDWVTVYRILNIFPLELKDAISESERECNLYSKWGEKLANAVFVKEGKLLQLFQLLNEQQFLKNKKNISFSYAEEGDRLSDNYLKKQIECYHKAIKVSPNYFHAWSNLGISYGKQKKYQKALDAFEKAQLVSPNSFLPSCNIGHTYNLQKKYDKAIIELTKSIAISPNSYQIWINIGISYSMLKMHDESISAFKKVLELAPEVYDSWYNLGIIYFELNQYDNAVNAFQNVINIAPKFHEAWLNMGIVYGQLKQYDNAIDAFQNTVNILPTKHEAWFNMGLSFYELAKFDDAIYSYEKAIQIQSENIEYNQVIGWTHLVLHNYSNAKQYFQKILKLSNNKNEVASMNLGHIYLLQNNSAIALKRYKKSIPIWNDINEFWQGMKTDYTDLQMQQKGITPEAYQAIITQLKKEFSEK